MSKEIGLFFALVWVFWAIPANAKETLPQETLVLSRSVGHYMGGRIEPKAVTNQFDCQDRIYATWKLDKELSGEHVFSFEWYNPSGKLALVQHQDIKSQADTQAWVSKWFVLSGSGLQGLANAMGVSHVYNEYIGQWRLVLRRNQEKLTEQRFELLCWSFTRENIMP